MQDSACQDVETVTITAAITEFARPHGTLQNIEQVGQINLVDPLTQWLAGDHPSLGYGPLPESFSHRVTLGIYPQPLYRRGER